MYFQVRNGKFSFIYWDKDLRKNRRLKKSQTPEIKTEKEAEDFCRRWDATYDSLKLNIVYRLEWEKHFFNFQELLDLYLRVRKEEAPNSFGNDAYYLKYYVFPYFLTERGMNNLLTWHHEFEAFRDWLEIAKPLRLKVGQKTLAYSTKNNIIKSLNAFMSVLHRRRHLDELRKCRYFPKSKVRQKGDEAVIPDGIQTLIHEQLKKYCKRSADAFEVALGTGLRLNELLGLSLADFFSGAPSSSALKAALEPYQLKPLGFVTIDSQPISAGKLRNEAGVVPRKPLKGQRKIGGESARIIPIFKPEVFNTLARRWNAQQEAFRFKPHGPNPKDYLLFADLNKAVYSHALRLVQKRMKLEPAFTPHDTRHTFSTWLAEKTGGNYNLCRMILGHRSLEMTMKYVHMNERIQKQLLLTHQLENPIRLIG